MAGSADAAQFKRGSPTNGVDVIDEEESFIEKDGTACKGDS